MKERLIELLDKVHRTHLGKEYFERLGTIADYLLSNGVIVPPCKVGDTVYRTRGNYCGVKIHEGVVDQISIYKDGVIRFWVLGHPLGFACDDIGQTVFLTKEEAEKALAERREGK